MKVMAKNKKPISQLPSIYTSNYAVDCVAIDDLKRQENDYLLKVCVNWSLQTQNSKLQHKDCLIHI